MTGTQTAATTETEDCEFCDGKGALAVHIEATKEYGQRLIFGHNPESGSHLTFPCPWCSPEFSRVKRLEDEISKLHEQLGDLEDKNTIGDVVRSPVRRLAMAMEDRLKANDHKGGWEKCTYDYLFKRLAKEIEELQEAVLPIRKTNTHVEAAWEDPSIVEGEAADVANFAMMIADIYRRNWNPLTGEEEADGTGAREPPKASKYERCTNIVKGRCGHPGGPHQMYSDPGDEPPQSASLPCASGRHGDCRDKTCSCTDCGYHRPRSSSRGHMMSTVIQARDEMTREIIVSMSGHSDSLASLRLYQALREDFSLHVVLDHVPLTEDDAQRARVLPTAELHSDRHDPVERPSHYTDSGYEMTEVAIALGLTDYGLRYQAFKYLWRAGKKSATLQDLEKARWYLDREIRRLRYG